MVKSVIFVPLTHLGLDAERCVSYCRAHGYAVEGIFTDLRGAARHLSDKRASVLVVIADGIVIELGSEVVTEAIDPSRPEPQNAAQLVEDAARRAGFDGDPGQPRLRPVK